MYFADNLVIFDKYQNSLQNQVDTIVYEVDIIHTKGGALLKPHQKLYILNKHIKTT